jgi:hypothetical protein
MISISVCYEDSALIRIQPELTASCRLAAEFGNQLTSLKPNGLSHASVGCVE